MSDEELFKAIKEYSDNNDLANVRRANIFLRKIKDTCRAHASCEYCSYYRANYRCIVTSGIPENWEI